MSRPTTTMVQTTMPATTPPRVALRPSRARPLPGGPSRRSWWWGFSRFGVAAAKPALAFALLLLPLAACQKGGDEKRPAAEAQAPTRETVTLQGATMGTMWSLKVVVTSPEQSRAAVALQPRIEERLERINDLMSTYRQESELSRFNQHASTEPFPVSKETALVVRRSLEVGKATDGAFDVTLGPVIALWGFDKDGRRQEPPSEDQLVAARARVGLDRLSVEEGALVKSRPDVDVNLSAIAKGYGVDEVYDLVTKAGFQDLLVEIGGELRAHGTNAQGEPWRVGINLPRSGADPTAVLVTVPLEDRALATSGDYRNFFEAGGRRYSHIIDPRTGAPVRHDLVSVSVVAGDTMTADALATAGLVLGEERMREALKSFPGAEALFVHAKEGTKDTEGLKVSKTAGFPTLETK